MATLTAQQSAEYESARPRAATMNSFMSNRSRRSSNSKNKLEPTESTADKRRMMPSSKVDPRVAMTEAQPAAVALAETTIEDLRQTQHKDVDGSVITDPDRSNPTRYRLERPLDTIRKWNAAAEGTSNNRRSSYQNRPQSLGGDNRRSSYMSQNGYQSPPGRTRGGQGGYYNRQSSYGVRHDGFPEDGTPQPPYGRPVRQHNQQYHGVEDSPVSGHSYQQSYETMTSGSDEYGKSTNPSSQNSSFDRLHQMQMRKPDEHGNHYDNDAQYAQHNNNNSMRAPYPGMQDNNFTQPPQRAGPAPTPNNPKKPIQLNGENSGPPPTQADVYNAQPPKRQSWIKRRFSKRED